MLGVLLTVALFSSGGAVRADSIGRFTALNGAQVTANSDGGVKLNVALPASTIGNPKRVATYDAAVSLESPILVYVDPKTEAGGAVTNRYFCVDLYGDAARSTLLYTVQMMRQADGAVNCRTSGSWGDMPGVGGVEEVKFVIGADGLRSYVNDRLIEFWAVGRSAFTSGKAYLGFSAGIHSWGSAGDQTADVRVGNPSIMRSFASFSTQSVSPLTLALDLRGAIVSAVHFVAGGTAVILDADKYTVTDTLLTVDAEYLTSLCANIPGEYRLRLINSATELTVRLRISTAAGLELESGVTYDLYTGGDLSIEVYENDDTFIALTGMGIAAGDYTYAAESGTLLLKKSFLSGLSAGEAVFSAVSARAANIPLSLTVTDTAPPVVPAAGSFDAYVPADVVLHVDAHQNVLVSFTGNDITAEGYVYNEQAKTLTIKREYLSTLVPNDTYTFVFAGTYGNADVRVDVIHSEPATLGAALVNRVNRQNSIDAVFRFEMKYDVFVGVSGNGITAADYTFDKNTGLLFLFRDFLPTLAVGAHTFTVTSKYNAGIPIVVTVFDGVAPTLETGGDDVTLDKQELFDQTYTVRLNGATFVWVQTADGRVMPAHHYAYTESGDTATIVLKRDYFLTLPIDGYLFRIVFDTGEIRLAVALTNSERAQFIGGEEIVYLTADPATDLGVEIMTNKGIFLSVSGNGIWEDDYYYQDGTLYFRAAYLKTLPFTLSERFTVTFDNAMLYAYVSPPYRSDAIGLYHVEGGTAAAEGDWVRVTYDVVAGQGVLLGGVKIKYLFDVTRPITMQIDMIKASQKAGYPFVFTLSPDAYKLYYGNDPSVLFGAFEVGQSYLSSAFFGKSGVHDAPHTQVQHELLARKGSLETFVFDIGERQTDIYYNGRLIRSTPLVTRADFPDGNAYVLFSPFTWTKVGEETDTLIYRFRANGTLRCDDDFRLYNKNTGADVTLDVFTDGGIVDGVYLVDGETERPLNGYTVTYDYARARATVVFPSDAVRYNPLLMHPGTYTLRIKNESAYADVTLRVSDSRYIELVSKGDPVFDLNATGDLTVLTLANQDGFTRLSGSGITAEDYGFAAGMLTIERTFLSTFRSGELVLTLHSTLSIEGRPMSVHIIDTTPPDVIGGRERFFDLSFPNDVTYTLDLKRGAFDGFATGGPAAGEYDFDMATGVLFVRPAYAQRLTFGAHTFTMRIGYGAGVFSELTLVLHAGNSVAPVYADGAGAADGAMVLTHVAGEDLTVSVVANQGRFLRVEGGRLPRDAYHYDADKERLTLYAAWFDTVEAGEQLYAIVFDNGSLPLRIQVNDATDAVHTSDNHKYTELIVGTALAGAVFLCAAAFFIVVISRKRKIAKQEGDGE
jgi:RNase P/RNase MRP subunit p29